MTDLTAQPFERILLIKPSALGDIVHALPVLRGLRIRYPQAHISWLVNATYAPLLEGHPDLDDIVEFDRQSLRSMRSAFGGIARLPGFTRRLRRGKYDLAIDLQGLFRSGLMALASGAGVRLGLRPAREGAGLFYTHRVHAPTDGHHAVERNYAFGRALGFGDLPVTFALPVTAAGRDGLAHAARENGLDIDRRYVVVAPSSRWETKNWLPERFASAIDRMADAGVQMVLCGSAGERPLCERIARQCVHAPVNLAGCTNLQSLVALIGGAAAVLCNDSATSHLAMALDRPQITLFGPTDPARTGPYGRPNAVLRCSDLPCSPCFLRRLKDCPHDLACMTRLDVDTVCTRLRDALPDLQDKRIGG